MSKPIEKVLKKLNKNYVLDPDNLHLDGSDQSNQNTAHNLKKFGLGLVMQRRRRELFNLQRSCYLDYENELSLLTLPYFDTIIDEHLDHFYSNQDERFTFTYNKQNKNSGIHSLLRSIEKILLFAQNSANKSSGNCFKNMTLYSKNGPSNALEIPHMRSSVYGNE